MASTFATTVYPVPRRFVSLGKEPQGTPGVLTAPTWTFPMVSFTPVDKIEYLQDTAWRNAMAMLYNVVPGTRISDLSFGGPVFIDGIGHFINNCWGDYWQQILGTAGTATTLASSYTSGGTTVSVTSASGISVGTTIAVGALNTPNQEFRVATSVNGTTIGLSGALYQNHSGGAAVTPYTGAGTATTLSSSYTAGATTISVASTTGFSVGTYFAVGALGSTAQEVRTVAGTAASTITLSSPLYQNHNSGAAVTPWTGVTGVIHWFALLNSGNGAGGWPNAQPATLTISDFTGVPASTGTRQYGFTCLSELSLTADPSKLFEWDAKGTALMSAIAGSTPSANPTTTVPQASWNSSVFINGAEEYNNAMFKATLSRKLGPFFSNSGQQDFFALVRGSASASVALDWDPAVDESEYLLYLANTQPTLSIVAIGPGVTSFTLNAQDAAFVTGEIDDSHEAFGYKTTADLVSNTTNVGPSSGYGPCVIQLVNSVVAY